MGGTAIGNWVNAVNGWLTRERLRRYPVALLVVTVGAYAVRAARSDRLIESDGSIIGRDFLAFYMAGDMVRSGRSSDLYDLSAQSAYQTAFMAARDASWSRTCLFLNPPHYAWLMSLLTPLGYAGALVAWTVLSLCCFATTAWLWRRWLPRGRWGLIVILVMCVPPWFQALAGGQNTFPSLLILTGFCALVMAGRDAWAGVVLSLLAYKFQLLLVPVGWLMLTRRPRALIGLGAGIALTVGVTIVVCGPGACVDYARFAARLGEVMTRHGFDVYKQHSWYGLFYLSLHGWVPISSIRILTVTACVATLILAGAVARTAGAPRSPRRALALCAMVGAMIVTSPHLFHYDMLLAALPVVLWTAARADAAGAPGAAATRAILALGFVWLAVAGPIARVTHVQMTPVLMLSWIVVMWAGTRATEERSRGVHGEPAASM